MTTHKLTAATAALMVLAIASPAATASRIANQFPGQSVVNVNVSLNMEIPIVEDDVDAMSSAQVKGRKILYRLATSECPILKQTIAKTCRLTNLNVSTQIRRNNSPTPVSLYINGNAQFAITLKSHDDGD